MVSLYREFVYWRYDYEEFKRKQNSSKFNEIIRRGKQARTRYTYYSSIAKKKDLCKLRTYS